MTELLRRLRAAGDRAEGRPYSDMHGAADEIERLRAHQDETAKAWTKLTESQEQEIERLAWSNADLTQKNARLRAALKPLAALPLWRDHYSDGPDILNTSATVKYYFTPEHVRAARAAMNEQDAAK